jgi:CheY-like chemotaxis protein
MRFKRDLKESPLTAHYVVDHAPNVAQALLMFRNCAQPVPGQTGSDGAKAAYHVVLLDNQMPMTDGGSIDEDAGVRLFFISCFVLFACVLMRARG